MSTNQYLFFFVFGFVRLLPYKVNEFRGFLRHENLFSDCSIVGRVKVSKKGKKTETKTETVETETEHTFLYDMVMI